jgi:hypothetical protein
MYYSTGNGDLDDHGKDVILYMSNNKEVSSSDSVSYIYF